MNIFVSNLSFRFTDDDLKQLFEEYGEVNSAKIITDKFTGRSRGFGFVEMNDEDGNKAINELDKSEIDGRVIAVNVARPRTEGGGGGRGNDFSERRRQDRW